MKQHLARLTGVLAILCLLASCKKDTLSSTSEDFYFKAKFNGIEKSFTTRSLVKYYKVDGKFALAIVANIANETASITLWSQDSTFKSYKTFGDKSAGCNTNNSFDYTSNQLSGHENNSWGSVYLFDDVPERFECELTEVTSTYVRGKFTTDLYKRSLNLQKIAVTDGEFYVRVQ